MRNMPQCPRCDDEILVLITDKRYARLLCRECGWHFTFMPRPLEDALDKAIAEAVAEAKGKVID